MAVWLHHNNQTHWINWECSHWMRCIAVWHHNSDLSWFKSYLSSRSFRVKCDNNLSSFHDSSCGVPQGSVLGSLLFIMYTSPLNTLISSLSLDHHLYADDTQIFFSFSPTQLWLEHLSPSKRSSTYLFQDDR